MPKTTEEVITVQYDNSNDFNEHAARLHYRALQHGGIMSGQTEIRVFDKQYFNGKSWFVYSENEFIERSKILHKEKVRIYIGNNQRSTNKKTDIEVIALNALPVDIDGNPHTIENKPFCLELLRKYDTYMMQQGLPLSVGETAAGYCPYIFFDKPIEITDKNRQEIRELIQTFKEFVCKTFKHDKAEIDPVCFNLSRVTKEIGSFDFNRGGKTGWVREPVFVSTEKFFKLVKTLPQAKVQSIENYDTSTPKTCAFCEYALKNQLKGKQRYGRVAPSMSAYIRDLPNKEALQKQYQAVQDPSRPDVNALASWDRKPSKFWCGQLRHYAEENGLKTICEKCLEEAI